MALCPLLHISPPHAGLLAALRECEGCYYRVTIGGSSAATCVMMTGAEVPVTIAEKNKASAQRSCHILIAHGEWHLLCHFTCYFDQVGSTARFAHLNAESMTTLDTCRHSNRTTNSEQTKANEVKFLAGSEDKGRQQRSTNQSMWSNAAQSLRSAWI